MGRPKGAASVTAGEVALIRRLYRDGVRVADIVELARRSESVVYRLTRGMSRKKPPPPRGRHVDRNDEVLGLIEKGMSRAEVGELFGLSATQIGHIVATHPHLIYLLRVRKLRPSTVAKRYRMELSTAVRIAQGKTRKQVKRTRGGVA